MAFTLHRKQTFMLKMSPFSLKYDQNNTQNQIQFVKQQIYKHKTKKINSGALKKCKSISNRKKK